MAYADYRHRMPLRVRWAEVDLQGVVFNGHYLTYCDVCVTEYWRALGLRYPDDFLAQGSDTFVRKASIDYLAPARFDDDLEVCARAARLGRSSLRLQLEVFRSGAAPVALAGVELVYVNVDPATHTPKPWWPAFRSRVREFEHVAPEEAHG